MVVVGAVGVGVGALEAVSVAAWACCGSSWRCMWTTTWSGPSRESSLTCPPRP